MNPHPKPHLHDLEFLPVKISRVVFGLTQGFLSPGVGPQNVPQTAEIGHNGKFMGVS